MRPLPSRTTISLTPAQIAQKALPSVALIRVSDGVGTGFVVSPDGRIATNLHVIAGNHEATIVLADGREFTDVEILAVDASRDLALLRIAVGDLTPLPLGDSDAVIPGERVVAIGNPFGLGASVSDGLVSGLREITEDCRVLQIAAGAPLYNDGHFEACFRIYEGTILDLDRTLPSCPGARRALLEGIAEAGRRQTWSDKAGAAGRLRRDARAHRTHAAQLTHRSPPTLCVRCGQSAQPPAA